MKGDGENRLISAGPKRFVVRGPIPLKVVKLAYLEWVLSRVGGNQLEASRLVEVSYKTIQKYGGKRRK